jgi:hypothetical protein
VCRVPTWQLLTFSSCAATVDPIPAFASPTTPQKGTPTCAIYSFSIWYFIYLLIYLFDLLSTPAKEDKKKAQLRNYTIAGGRGVQHELPLGVSWKDLKAILASSNAPTTERMVKSLPLPREYVCTTLSLSLSLSFSFSLSFRFLFLSFPPYCFCHP